MQVSLKQVLTTSFTVSNGTLQGIVISPTLFNVMFYDLISVLARSDNAQFADDSSILCSLNNVWIAKIITKDGIGNILH